jgi:hypothetical protein
MENKYITEMSKEELILLVTEEEITTAVASINKRKSADFHSLPSITSSDPEYVLPFTFMS